MQVCWELRCSEQMFAAYEKLPSGKHTKKLWKTTMLNGKIHYFYGHFQ
jgi:hypothetical protein